MCGDVTVSACYVSHRSPGNKSTHHYQHGKPLESSTVANSSFKTDGTLGLSSTTSASSSVPHNFPPSTHSSPSSTTTIAPTVSSEPQTRDKPSSTTHRSFTKYLHGPSTVIYKSHFRPKTPSWLPIHYPTSNLQTTESAASLEPTTRIAEVRSTSQFHWYASTTRPQSKGSARVPYVKKSTSTTSPADHSTAEVNSFTTPSWSTNSSSSLSQSASSDNKTTVDSNSTVDLSEESQLRDNATWLLNRLRVNATSTADTILGRLLARLFASGD